MRIADARTCRVLALPWMILAGDAVACGIMMLIGGTRPDLLFGEFEPITLMNAIQLAVCARLSLQIFRVRSQQDPRAATFWRWTFAGSVFLLLDELISFHETNGPLMGVLRGSLGISSHVTIGGTDVLSVGDAVQLLYAIPVLAICWIYRREFVRDRRALGFFGTGAALLAISLFMDAGPTNGRALPGGLDLGKHWFKAIEESFKLLGFGAILGDFWEVCRRVEATTPVRPDRAASRRSGVRPQRFGPVRPRSSV